MVLWTNTLDALDLPADRDLGIDQAHHTLSRRHNDPQAKPRSIIFKFGSYHTKEEILRSAWQKKQIFYNDTHFYVDHDFPLKVLKKCSEYTEAKKVLREKQIMFQTPYPARMHVFYEDGYSRMSQRQRGTWLNEGFLLRW